MKKTFLIGALAAALASAGFAVPALAHQGETHAQAPQTAEGEGVVRSIDARANTVTIAHGPIAALGWRCRSNEHSNRLFHKAADGRARLGCPFLELREKTVVEGDGRPHDARS